MPNATYVPSRIGEGHFTDFQAPASGSTDNGKTWAWNSATSKFEPVSLPSGGIPGGLNTQIQYNNNGEFGGDGGFTYSGSGVATLTGRLVVPAISPAANAVNSTGFSNASGVRILSVDSVLNYVGVGTTTPSAILHVAGDTPRIRLQNTAANGKTMEFFAGTSGIGIGNPTNISQIIIDASAPNSSLYIGNRAIFGTGEGIASASGTDMMIKSDTGGTVSRTVAIQAYNGSAWQTVLTAPNKSSGNIDLLLVNNGGRVVIGNTSATALLDVAASTTARASLRIRSGVAPTTPNDGDIWFDGTNLKFFDGSATRTITWT